MLCPRVTQVRQQFVFEESERTEEPEIGMEPLCIEDSSRIQEAWPFNSKLTESLNIDEEKNGETSVIKIICCKNSNLSVCC